MRLKIAAAILFLLVCILPGSKAGFFNGLPLSAFEICIAFFFFTAIFGTSWEKIKNAKRIVFIALILLLFFQALSYKFLPYGWSVCAFSEASSVPLKSSCEPSFEDPSGERGFIYSKINFTSENMPLYFMNNCKSFGFYKPGQPSRNSLPFTAKAAAYIYPRGEAQLTVEAERNLSIKINDDEYEYASPNEKAYFDLEPDKKNHIQVSYISSRKDGNKFFLETSNGQPFYANRENYFERWISVYRTINYFLIMLLAAVFVHGFILNFQTLSKKNKIAISVLATLTASMAIFILAGELKFKEVIIYFNLITFVASLIFIFTGDHARKKMLPLIFLIIFVSSCVIVSCRVLPEKVIIFSGGNDELTHETFARMFLDVSDFKEFMYIAGETISYYQPLHRYILFLLHIFLGEPMWGIYLSQIVLFNTAIILLAYALSKTVGLPSSLAFSFLYLGLFVFNADHNIVRLLQSPLQQAIALPLFVACVAAVLFFAGSGKIKNGGCLILGLVLGMSFMIRTDWFPAIFIFLFLAAYLLWKEIRCFNKITKISILLIGFIVFPLFVGLRNYYVAGIFSVFPTSGFVNLLADIKEPIQNKVDFYEASNVKIIKETIIAFSGRYLELAKLLLNNIRKSMIGDYLLRQLFWYSMLALLIPSAIVAIKRKTYLILKFLVFFFFSLASLSLLGSIFRQHNGMAMLGIYDFLLIIVLALEMQIIIMSLWNRLAKKYM